MSLEEPMHLDVFDLEKPGRAAAGRPLSRILASALSATLLGYASAGAPIGVQQTHASSRHGYALLYEILEQEREVSKLLFHQSVAGGARDGRRCDRRDL